MEDNCKLAVEIGSGAKEPVDNWKHRNESMRCKACMWFVVKLGNVLNVSNPIGRCRRHAPTMAGYPVVFADDWCGDHKLDENSKGK